MMSLQSHISYLGAPGGVLRALCAFALGSMLALTSCIYDSPADDPIPEPSPLQYFIQLTLANTPMSRDGSNPNGGDDSNASITAETNENTISNATLLLYEKSINDPVTAADAIFQVMYFSEFTQETETGVWASNKVEINFTIDESVKAKTYHAVVITNCGDMTSTFKNMTLPQLRNYVFSGDQWSAKNKSYKTGTDNFLPVNVASYQDFVMTSSGEVSVSFATESNTNYNGIGLYTIGKIYVQRLAARIDFAFDETNTNDYVVYSDGTEDVIKLPGSVEINTAVRYPIWNRKSDGQADELSGQYFLLTDFEVINSYAGGSYALKRVGADASGLTGVVYMGAESKDIEKNATNYVLSPADASDDHFKTFTFSFAELTASGAKRNNQESSGSNTYPSYTLTYLRENTNRNNHYTTLRLGGYVGKPATDTDWDFSESSVVRQTYDIVIKHSDPTGKGAPADPMHYGIVRNNIYRIAIDKIVRTSIIDMAVYWYYWDGTDYVPVTTSFVATIDPVPDNFGTPND